MKVTTGNQKTAHIAAINVVALMATLARYFNHSANDARTIAYCSEGTPGKRHFRVSADMLDFKGDKLHWEGTR